MILHLQRITYNAKTEARADIRIKHLTSNSILQILFNFSCFCIALIPFIYFHLYYITNCIEKIVISMHKKKFVAKVRNS